MTDPHYGGAFHYGRPLKGHGWLPMTNAELVKTMANYIAEHAPAGENKSAWMPKKSLEVYG